MTLNAANNWRYTWEKLPAYNKDGSKIVWSVVEKEPEGYTVLIARDGVTFTVTNTYAPNKTMTRTVVKVWDDKGYATLALQNGVDIKTVSGMLGHYSAGFTLDTYTHVTTLAQTKAAETMGGLLANAAGS